MFVQKHLVNEMLNQLDKYIGFRTEISICVDAMIQYCPLNSNVEYCTKQCELKCRKEH